MRKISAPAILAIAVAPLLALGVGAAAAAGPGAAASGTAVTRHTAPSGPRLNPGSLPLTFQANEGQAAPAVRYLGQTQGVTALFTQTGVTLDLARAPARPGAHSGSGSGAGAQAQAQVTLAFLHANPNARITGGGRQPGTVNYFLGNDPARWRTAIPTFTQVVYYDVWPGVNVGFTAANGTLKYWFTLAPKASASEIRLAYTGARNLTLARSGGLVINAPSTRLNDQAPVSTQTLAGHQAPILSRYRLSGGTRFGFTIGRRAHGAAVTIDPGLDYGTYLGGSVADAAFSIDTDTAGDVYVFGHTESPDFPITAGAYQRELPAGIGVTFFVTKFNPAGTGLIYSTFVGGTGYQALAWGALDSAGDAYVTGATQSTDFPTTPGAYRTTPYPASFQSVLFKLNPTGSKLLYSTYLAPDFGPGGSYGRSIAAAPDGSVIVIGQITADYAPTTPGAFQTVYPGGVDTGYVARVNPTGTGLIYASYLGSPLTNQGALLGPLSGDPDCVPASVAADSRGAAYIAGYCDAGFPTTPGAYQATAAPAGGGLLVKLDPSGRLDYATYWGKGVNIVPPGSPNPVVYLYPRAFGVAIDSKGNAYLGGFAPAKSIPATAGAYQSDCKPDNPTPFDAHPVCGAVAEFNATGTRLLYSSYFGGNQNPDSLFDTEVLSLSVDANGRMYIVGMTSPGDVPITSNAYESSPGNFAVPFFLAVLGKGGVEYSTYYGGASPICFGPLCGVQGMINIAPEVKSGSVYLGGVSETGMPVSPGAFQRTYPGGINAVWIGKLGLPALPSGG